MSVSIATTSPPIEIVFHGCSRTHSIFDFLGPSPSSFSSTTSILWVSVGCRWSAMTAEYNSSHSAGKAKGLWASAQSDSQHVLRLSRQPLRTLPRDPVVQKLLAGNWLLN